MDKLELCLIPRASLLLCALKASDVTQELVNLSLTTFKCVTAGQWQMLLLKQKKKKKKRLLYALNNKLSFSDALFYSLALFVL